MAKGDDIPKTDPSQIEALIQRLKQSNIEPRDAQLVERLLRLLLSMASLLQHKNASIKQLIFGPSSDKCAVTGSSTEEEAAASGEDSEQRPGSDSSPGTVRSSSTDRKPKRPGHGRMGRVESLRFQSCRKSAQSRLMETRSRDGSVSVRREPSGRSI